MCIHIQYAGCHYEVFVEEIKVEERAVAGPRREIADTKNPHHIAAPFDSDLWLVHKKEGDSVKAGEEVLNLSLMKTEYAVTSSVDGVVKRVVVFTDYKTDKKMVPVKKGALLMELAPPRERCRNCDAEVEKDYQFCPRCGNNLESQG